MEFPQIIRIKVEKMARDEYPVLKAVTDKYVVFERVCLRVRE